MTDILDPSYESDLTEEEHERLILMSEHAIAKPLSLKEHALSALYAIASGADDTREFYEDIEIVKKALESLPD